MAHSAASNGRKLPGNDDRRCRDSRRARAPSILFPLLYRRNCVRAPDKAQCRGGCSRWAVCIVGVHFRWSSYGSRVAGSFRGTEWSAWWILVLWKVAERLGAERKGHVLTELFHSALLFARTLQSEPIQLLTKTFRRVWRYELNSAEFDVCSSLVKSLIILVNPNNHLHRSTKKPMKKSAQYDCTECNIIYHLINQSINQPLSMSSLQSQPSRQYSQIMN